MPGQASEIAGQLSFRWPQSRSLEILQRATELIPLQKGSRIEAALAAIRREFPDVTDFEREFPSLCFSLATGVGKTRLMGGFIAYLRTAQAIRNYLVLAPNLTIYNKLITDFTPNTPKYVFRGIPDFARTPPTIVTGDDFEHRVYAGGRDGTAINIFNIFKINSDLRSGRTARVRSLREEIGQSYFDYLSGLEDLVLIMDEAHRYRGTAGVRAINELSPIIGLELTATPYVETGRGAVPFRNVIFGYPLSQAIHDGFVKEPAVVTRENFVTTGMSPDAIERIKIEDGLRLHEKTKEELSIYAQERGERQVKPLMLIIARDTAHAAKLVAAIQSETFLQGRYADKVIQVDSSVAEDDLVGRLLNVEHAEEPTEIVVHVNMLKEGWDVSNLYTIVPLRAANARVLIEQSIGRGLRLPYGRRTGLPALDRLSLVSHDRFQEIVDEARKSDSPIQMQQVFLPARDMGRTIRVVSQPLFVTKLGLEADTQDPRSFGAFEEGPELGSAAGQAVVAQIYDRIRELEAILPSIEHLRTRHVQDGIADAVRCTAAQAANLADQVERTARTYVEHMIDIPVIRTLPEGTVHSAVRPFELPALPRFEPPPEHLWSSNLRTGEVERVRTEPGMPGERPLAEYVVDGLLQFDDVAYSEHSAILYDLAGQAVRQLLTYLSEEDARKVMHLHQEEIARFVHEQMQRNSWQDAEIKYVPQVVRGFTALRPSVYQLAEEHALLDFRRSPSDKSNMQRFLFHGFSRCLYPTQKFDSDPERILAVILDREALKWCKPARGQIQISYRNLSRDSGYQPDFIAESETSSLMIEVKASRRLGDEDVIAKREAALEWCRYASDHAVRNGGKPWRLLLIPHDDIAENVTLAGLIERYLQS